MTAAIALLLADARTPTGTYAHSAGLEAAVRDGLTAAEMPAFIAGRLATVAYTEAALAAAAVLAGGDLGELLTLDAEALARCPSPALRAAGRTLGRSLLRTGALLFPGASDLATYRAASDRTPRPVALGVVASAGGLGPDDAALVSLYDDASGVASAAIKLLPVDAAQSVAWIAALAPELTRLATNAAAAALRDELPSLSAPLIELRSLPHALDARRLFAS